MRIEESSSTKHEYLDGEIYAMAGGSPLHAALAMRMGAELVRQLEGSPCRVYSSDLRVRIVATGLATYPDVTVIRGPVEAEPGDPHTAVNPRVVVEVLSPSTEECDLGDKLSQYQRAPSIQAVVVFQGERRIRLHERREEAWEHLDGRGGDVLKITALGAELDVTRIYDAAGAP